MRQAITTAWGLSHVTLAQGRSSVSEAINVRFCQNEWKRVEPYHPAQFAAKAGDPCHTGGGYDSIHSAYHLSRAVSKSAIVKAGHRRDSATSRQWRAARSAARRTVPAGVLYRTVTGTTGPKPGLVRRHGSCFVLLSRSSFL
jgi:hypothetical protein